MRKDHRIIRGLLSAERSKNPWPTQGRFRGAKAEGIRYEKLVAKATNGLHNQWFKFFDENGQGFCCPDVILDLPEGLFVLECKLTDTEYAKSQLLGLYLPIVSHVFGQPACGIVVTKHVGRKSYGITDSLADAITLAAKTIPTLHWLGRGPL
jgi:hypothetical protein